MELHPISAYLKAHERLVLSVVAGLVLWFAIGKIDTLILHHDQANLEQAKVTAQVQAEKNTALAAQVATQAAQYKELADKVQSQNAALEQANVQLSQALVKQQKTDATLPPTELAARWTMLVPQATVAVTPSGVTLNSASAVATVQTLEQVPVLKTELSNTNGRLENVDKLLAASGQQVATLNSQVSGLQLQIVDNSKVCTAQVSVVKAEARRSKRRWFLVGYVAGFLSRQYIKTATGL